MMQAVVRTLDHLDRRFAQVDADQMTFESMNPARLMTARDRHNEVW